MVFFFSNDQMFPCLTSGQDSSERQQWDRKTTRRDSDSLFNWQSLQPAIVISTYSHLRHAPTKSVRVISMSAHSVRFCGQKTNSVFGSYFITSVNWCKGFTVAVKPALYPHVVPLAWSCSLPFVTKHFTGQHNRNSQSQDLKLMWERIPKRGQNNANTTCKRKPKLWSGPLLQRQLHGQIKLNAS